MSAPTKPEPSSQLPHPTLPKGGGALSPIGEKFSTNAQTGTAGLSIPLPLTPARGGSGPQLALTYDSGAGNGAFGIGWSIGVPAITRKTDRGLPRYRAFGAEDDDVFILAGVEDLVPIASPVPQANGELMIAYRPRVDTMFGRIERRRRPSGEEYWVTITKDNVRSVFGDSDQARVADPDNSQRVFRWNLEWTDDDRGNVVAYYYKGENPEPQRPVTNRYLRAVGYLNERPRTDRTLSPIAQPLDAWPLLVMFNYGEHDLAKIADGTDGPFDEVESALRADPFSNRRATFEVRTSRLCSDVMMLHRITTDGRYDRAVGAVHAVTRVLRLHYQTSERVTYLELVTQEGWRRRDDLRTYEVGAMPAVKLTYSDAEHPNLGVEVLDRSSTEGSFSAFDGRDTQLLDYDGEGLPGVFATEGDAWWYKRPNGAPEDGSSRWSPPRKIMRHPCVALGAGGAHLQDWNSDGALDVVQLRGSMRGVFVRQPLPLGNELVDEDWHPFRPFARFPPDVDFADPNLRFVDLDGDGFADILINHEGEFRWHAALAGIEVRGRDGYGEERRMPKVADPSDPHDGRAPIFANHTEAVLLADMTGDGLADIVHVAASSCSYWPNLGYGRFGRRIVMHRTPILASRHMFDPTRVHFADFDGTGTADLVYLDTDGVRVFPNLAGNAFGAEIVVPLPTPGQVDILDLWGRGTPTVVWSSGAARDRDRHVRYVDLYPIKPHLLRTIENGFGLTRTIEYGTSTQHYLADRRAGRPWITRLAFPVQVIDRITTVDTVAGTRDVSTYRYHHGYFDGSEREFRGFGMVEVRDTEDFGAFYGVSSGEISGIDRALHRPPVVTKTWFHTGAFVGNEFVSTQFRSEYDRSDALAAELPDTVFPPGLTPEEARESMRALRGHVLRVEVFAEDADQGDPASVARASRPYETTESNFTVRLELARGERRYAVVSVHPRESIVSHYERTGSDPRVAHELSIGISPTGVITDRVAIAYRRRDFDPATSPAKLVAQGITYATLAHVEVRDPVSMDPESFRRDVTVRDETFELIGLPDHALGFDEVAGFALAAVEQPYNPARRLTDRAGFAVGKHLMRRTRHRYYDEHGAAVLGVDAVTMRVLPARIEVLAHTTATLAAIVAREPTLDLATLLPSPRGGYLRDPDGTYWAPTPTARYAADFYTVIAVASPFGGVRRVDYDPLFALAHTAYDAVDNPTTIENDYRLFQPRAVRDANGTTQSTEVDVLGIVTALHIRQGALGGQLLTVRYGFYDPATRAPAWVRGESSPDFGVGQQLSEVAWVYSDGTGREAGRKVLVPAGDALLPNGAISFAAERWVGTGQTIRDNKGHPVKQYEPYFSTTSEFETEAELVNRGVTPVIRYDPTGRTIRTDLPDGTFRDVAFDVWSHTSRDEIDTLDADVPWYVERQGLAPTNPRRVAADRAFLLRATPTREFSDPLGRTIVSSRDNQQAAPIETLHEYDVMGSVLAVIDPRDSEVEVTSYDVAGRAMEVSAADAGVTTSLVDAAGKALVVWRGGAPALVRIEHDYDLADRVAQVRVTEGGVAPVVPERVVYRDWNQGPPPPNAAGRIAIELDGAGLVRYAYDFAGRAVSVERRVMLDATEIPDWSGAAAWDGVDGLPPTVDALLDGEVFATTSSYDAMGRVLVETAPDGSVTTRGYDVAGRVDALVVVDPTGTSQTIVAGAEFDEKSRRKTLRLGHDVTTTYAYDARTFRLDHLYTEGPAGERYQDLAYTYDAVGNVMRIHDDADDTLYYANGVARPELDYRYDALYRLVSARGREHASQATFDQRDLPGALEGIPISASTDLAQIAEYIETYVYDDADNIKKMTHQHGTASRWVRGYDTAATSNHLLTTHVGGADGHYAYDSRGNMTAMAHLDDMRWTHRDQLWMATRTKVGNDPTPRDPVAPDAKRQPVYFAYDQRGQRVRKISQNGALRRDRIYVGSYEIYRETRGTKLELERSMLSASDGATRLAMFERRTPRSPDDGSTTALWRFQHDNHLGSAVLELSETRVRLSYEELHPYGTTAMCSVRTGTPPKRYRFSGMERDDETGLALHGARFYAPWLARWTTADPVRSGSNLYAYASNRPVVLVDRDGHEPAHPEPEDPHAKLKPHNSHDPITTLDHKLHPTHPFMTSAEFLFVRFVEDPAHHALELLHKFPNSAGKNTLGVLFPNQTMRFLRFAEIGAKVLGGANLVLGGVEILSGGRQLVRSSKHAALSATRGKFTLLHGVVTTLSGAAALLGATGAGVVLSGLGGGLLGGRLLDSALGLSGLFAWKAADIESRLTTGLSRHHARVKDNVDAEAFARHAHMETELRQIKADIEQVKQDRKDLRELIGSLNRPTFVESNQPTKRVVPPRKVRLNELAPGTTLQFQHGTLTVH